LHNIIWIILVISKFTKLTFLHWYTLLVRFVFVNNSLQQFRCTWSTGVEKGSADHKPDYCCWSILFHEAHNVHATRPDCESITALSDRNNIFAAWLAAISYTLTNT
jgi:hypothetical protein